jgi:hypothetical protein
MKRNISTVLGASMIILILMTGPAMAGKSVFGLTWNLSSPTGNTSDFLSDFSFRGMGFEYKTFRTPDVAFGLNVGWNVMVEEMDNTFEIDGFSVTGMRHHYVNTVPVFVSGYRYFGPQRGTRYYVAGHGGAAWLEQRMDLGLYSRSEDNWHLSFAPEIGVQMPYSSFLGSLSLRYNYMLKAGDMEAQSYLELRLGFGM